MKDADPLILAVDQGTGSTKALLSDSAGRTVASGSVPIGLSAPAAGHVEQSAEEIWDSCLNAIEACLRGVDSTRVIALGISNQRESLVLWERRTGRPVGPLLSWQDQRTAGDRARLADAGWAREVQARSGLPLDPMFSALKAKWLLDNYDPTRSRSRAGELCLGTVDSWLLSRLGQRQHVIEVGNASRTQLLNVRDRCWDESLLEIFAVPSQVLPEIRPSEGIFCTIAGNPFLPDGVPVAAVMGDSHSALFAQQGWRPGRVKATYGSGNSVMAIAPSATDVPESLCLTLAWDVDGPAWAMEGTNRSAGSTLVWLASLFGTTPEELVADAAAVASEGVYVVPAFNGLAAPWWDDAAAGLLCGLRYSTGRSQIARAALESISHQVEDVVSEFERAGVDVSTLLADGGPASNPVLMQFQADISGRRIERAAEPNLSAVGAAHLAGKAVGLWTWSDLEGLERRTDVYEPGMPAAQRDTHRAGWSTAVARARMPRRGQE